MELWSIILIALGLSADCFAVAFSGSMSLKALSFLRVFRVSLSFGVFQALMPVLGWAVGRTVVELIAGYDHWVAFILLALVGGKMLWESSHPRESRRNNTDITRGWLLLTLSVATSIDALAVGLAFAFMKIDIVIASSIIGVVALVTTAVGLLVGRKAGHLFGQRAEIIGGLILIGIGVRILLEHVL